MKVGNDGFEPKDSTKFLVKMIENDNDVEK
jgi:hypothetical protein